MAYVIFEHEHVFLYESNGYHSEIQGMLNLWVGAYRNYELITALATGSTTRRWDRK